MRGSRRKLFGLKTDTIPRGWWLEYDWFDNLVKEGMENTTAKQSPPTLAGARTQRVLVATTAMLAFISFWRAAAIVLNDMGSSAFYAGAIAEHFVGKAAPWFILAIMLLAYAVRSSTSRAAACSCAAACIAW